MKRILIPAIAVIVCALTLTAFTALPASEGEALAAGSEYYICISPSDDALAGNAEAQPSDIAVSVNSDDGNAEILFYLTQSYYYKVSRYGTTYVLSDLAELGFFIQGDLPEGALIAALPDGAEPSGAMPSVALTLAKGAEVKLNNGLTVNGTNAAGYSFSFLGYSHASDGTLMVAFSAKNAATTTFGTADRSSFEAFVLPWHPVAEAHRSALLAPDEPVIEDGNGDLTAGTPSHALRIVLIIGIAVPAVLIVILIFKPTSDNRDRRDDRRAMRRRDDRRGIDYDRERSYASDRDRYDRGYRDYERRDYPEMRDDGYSPRDRRDDDRRY